MNCLEFRRSINADPGTKDSDVLRHAQECHGCKAYAAHITNLEHSLKQAIELDVPQQLAAQILLRQSTEQQHFKRTRRLRWMSIAAGCFLIAGLSGRLWLVDAPDSLDTTVLAHIHDEINHLEDTDKVPLAQLNDVLRPFKTQLQQPIGQISYAGICLIRNYDGVHIVLQSEAGPVTILLMPGEYINQRVTIHDQRFHGIIVPTSHGSMAIIAEQNAVIDKIEQQLRASATMIF